MRGVPVLSSVQALMAETHDPGQALLYIIISGEVLLSYAAFAALLHINGSRCVRIFPILPRFYHGGRAMWLLLCSLPDGFCGHHVWAHAGSGELSVDLSWF
jgi:hypothetical protein